MNSKEQEEMKQVILEKIEDTEKEIVQLKELTKPVKPDNAYGRLSGSKRAGSKNFSGHWITQRRTATATAPNAVIPFPLDD